MTTTDGGGRGGAVGHGNDAVSDTRKLSWRYSLTSQGGGRRGGDGGNIQSDAGEDAGDGLGGDTGEHGDDDEEEEEEEEKEGTGTTAGATGAAAAAAVGGTGEKVKENPPHPSVADPRTRRWMILADGGQKHCVQ